MLSKKTIKILDRGPSSTSLPSEDELGPLPRLESSNRKKSSQHDADVSKYLKTNLHRGSMATAPPEGFKDLLLDFDDDDYSGLWQTTTLRRSIGGIDIGDIPSITDHTTLSSQTLDYQISRQVMKEESKNKMQGTLGPIEEDLNEQDQGEDRRKKDEELNINDGEDFKEGQNVNKQDEVDLNNAVESKKDADKQKEDLSKQEEKEDLDREEKEQSTGNYFIMRIALLVVVIVVVMSYSDYKDYLSWILP